MGNFKEITQKIATLNYEELFLLEEQLSTQIEIQKQDIHKQVAEQVHECPHCYSKKIIKWGKYKEMKRYMCKLCSRTFIPTTGTVIHYLKKPNAFLNYTTIMFSESLSSLEIEAKRIGVSKTTAFNWRHKILISLGLETPTFNSVTEMDDVWFRYSQKGRKGLKYSRKRGRSSHKGDNNFVTKLLITNERGGSLDMSVIKIGRLSGQDISRKLKGKFGENAVLISDKHSGIRKFSKVEQINHKDFKASNHVENKIYHVQGINYLAGVIDDKVNKQLRGVSTKYLQNYATWLSVKERYKKSKEKVKNIIINCLSNIRAWDMYINIEKLYEQFILNHSVRTYRCPTQIIQKSKYWNFENAKLGSFI